MKKIIKNGTIVTAADTYQGEILIEDGKITQIGTNLSAIGAEVIDAKGCFVFP
ncbi:MAG: dihydropyrimidinase, partial [Bacillus sp. (in: firmicutes)]